MNNDENKKYFLLAQEKDAVGRYWYKAGTKEGCVYGISTISEYADFNKNDFVIREVEVDPITEGFNLVAAYHYINGKETVTE